MPRLTILQIIVLFIKVGKPSKQRLFLVLYDLNKSPEAAMKKILLFVSLLTASFALHAQPELKGSPEELRHFLHPSERIVSLHGQAEEKAYSDRAIISLVITTEDKLLSNSIASNSNLRKFITTQLTTAGINNDSIKSSKFSTSPQYGWFGKKPDSYKVVNRMAVTITDESQLKNIATVADTKTEIELADTAFEHSKADEYKNKVKKLALEKAMKQKAFYESSLGVTLTPVGFRNSQIRFRGTQGANMLEEIVVTASKRSMGKMQDMAYSRPATKQTPSFDEIEYEAEIYIDFKIETVDSSK